MKKYDKFEFSSLTCNCCKRTLYAGQDEEILNNCFSADHYKTDGTTSEIDLCPECYDKILGPYAETLKLEFEDEEQQ